MKVLFFLAGLGAIAACLYEPAPWYVWAIVLMFNAVTFWMIFANLEYGMDIDPHNLTLLYPKQTRIIALSDIFEVRVIDGADTTDLDIVPAKGRTIRVHPWAWPGSRIIRKELTLRGIRVVDA